MAWLRDSLFPPLLADERERRLRLFRTLLLVQSGTVVFLIAVCIGDALLYPRYVPLLIGFGLAFLFFSLLGYRLAQRGAFYLGATLLILSLLPLYTFFVCFYGSRGPLSYLYIWPIMLAAVLLEAPWVFVMAVLVALLYGTISYLELYQFWPIPIHGADLFEVWHRPSDVDLILYYHSETLTVILGYVAVAFFAWVAVRSLHRMLQRSRRQAAELEQYSTELEGMVSARTVELSQATKHLQTSLALIREGGSPILPIFQGVVLVPLVGVIDSERIRLVRERLLRQVAENRAHAVILDITGVPVVDTFVAKALVQTARGVRMLGATPILVGIRRKVSRTIVDLEVDLRGISTHAGLQDGLTYALSQVGAQIAVREQ